MRTPGRTALSLLGSAALLVAGATAAHAAPGYFYDDTVGGVYAGTAHGTSIANPTLATPSAFALVHACGTSQFDAAVSGLGGWSFSSFSMTCLNNKGGTTTLNALGAFGTTGGQYSPVAGGRDGLIALPAPSPGLVLRVVMTLPGLGIPSLTCDYGLTTTTPAYFNWFNRTNANRPVAYNPHAQLALTGASFQRLTADVRCSAALGLSGKYQVLATPSGHDLRLGP
ncbi:hypothetical protein [Actinomadura hibisca]|uniref:hypothetical protein n=1 Tax=Actinomadura hibisca TaxID=68565 RepID=UPI0008360B01|nr:hypothetical protein [Actinomadura hibisca]